ncbi:hypothetical protein EJB05_29620 [Eragrostis curvula]|uniref:Uncharacterized protein n=1 Tax=Eragrostis curvula TaxID=38414 RepID=A0A5J9T6N2_9POAL|nr:hypothetical protein EJB05_47044 [Eragrostis curvula]TVU27042.1 hypothetical protein EJB05_29620 [Eragrostis curvula]
MHADVLQAELLRQPRADYIEAVLDCDSADGGGSVTADGAKVWGRRPHGERKTWMDVKRIPLSLPIVQLSFTLSFMHSVL